MGGTLSCAGDKRGQYGEDKIPYGTPMVKPVEDGSTITFRDIKTATDDTGNVYSTFLISLIIDFIKERQKPYLPFDSQPFG